jgi:SAM-dependent methyltransferase
MRSARYRAGVDPDRRRTWEHRHRVDEAPGAPSRFVVEALDTLAIVTPPAGRALDVACGRGRHALLLAERGYAVDGVDFAVPALMAIRRSAVASGLAIDCVAADVTTWPIPAARYALVVVVNFLERALLRSLREAVAPGGALLYETHQRVDGMPPPIRPEFCLAPGELDELCRGWDVLARIDGTALHRGTPTPRAGILARRPASPH